MKKNRILGLASAIALMAAGACSNDVIDPSKNQGQLTGDDGSGGFFMNVDFQMPSGNLATRSETWDPDDTENNPDGYNSSGGVEIGTDAENFVSSALIVIAASESKPEANIKKYGFIVAGEVPGNRIATAGINEGSKRYRATARLQKENLNQIYNTYGDNQVPPVYVFVFCNPTNDLLNKFDGTNTDFGSSDWIDAICEVLQSKDATLDKNVGIWSTNSFLMNNVHLAVRELPKKLLDWENYTTVENPFHLSNTNTGCEVNIDNSSSNKRGVVLVERSVARFDFKDGSENNNTYKVLMNTDEEGNVNDAQPVVDIQIQKMCLVNMCNQFYYIPRTSPTGQLTDYEICGVEKPWDRGTNGKYSNGNYVVGPYAEDFGGKAIMTGFSKYFNFPFFDENGSFNNETMSSTLWDVVKVEDVLKGTPDNYSGTTTKPVNPGSYRVWRYVTENVIPDNQDNQMNGISTGVVFKGKLLGNEGVFDADKDYYEEDWNKDNLKNLANCLNGKDFTYNGENIKVEGNAKHDPILYYFAGHLYLGWRHFRQAAIQASVTINTAGEMEFNRSNSLYKAVFGEGPIPTYDQDKDEDGTPETYNMVYVKPDGSQVTIKDPMWEAALKNQEGEEYAGYLSSANYAWSQWALNGKEINDNSDSAMLTKMRKAVTGAGITIYQSSVDADYGAGYYCYYYYWNRHNDNGLNGSMGPMEFDVVRNNVYKLSIDKISRLGHPRIPDNDPDNPTPDTPDESDEIYLDVRVEIAPWVVRVNSIVF